MLWKEWKISGNEKLKNSKHLCLYLRYILQCKKLYVAAHYFFFYSGQTIKEINTNCNVRENTKKTKL